MITQYFGFTRDFTKKWNNNVYFQLSKIICRFKDQVRAPLLLYSYRLFTATTIILAVLMVFYVRGDVLLITLALVALAGFV